MQMENDYENYSAEDKQSHELTHRDTQNAELLKISTEFAISEHTDGEEKNNTLFPFKKSVENIVLWFNLA